MNVPRADLRFRRPVEDDYPRIIGVVDEWWEGRRVRSMLPRLWFQHMTGTSWIAEDDDGRLRGFIVAFVSAEYPTAGYVHMIGADPNRRRAGTGRALYERAFADLAARGATHVTAVTWREIGAPSRSTARWVSGSTMARERGRSSVRRRTPTTTATARTGSSSTEISDANHGRGNRRAVGGVEDVHAAVARCAVDAREVLRCSVAYTACWPRSS
jgi:GNAT superfamily N-acetyltransferase